MTPTFEIQGLRAYGEAGEAILKGVSFNVLPREIFGLIGPAGSGKTTLLRILNRTVELDRRKTRVTGALRFEGRDLFAPDLDVSELRRQVGMVFAVPLPLPMSIRENITLGMRLAGIPQQEWAGRVESSLTAAALFGEVKDRLDTPATTLSGGQQQRLCLARALALDPKVLLLDEPCSGLDPISTARIEEALQVLKERISVVLVTNNVKQAARVADRTAFLCLGELVELNATVRLFTTPEQARTADYISGRFG